MASLDSTGGDHAPFGSLLLDQIQFVEEGPPSQEEIHGIISDVAGVHCTSEDYDRLSQSFNGMLCRNLSFHRYVTDQPTSIEQERVVTLGWKNLTVATGSKELLHCVNGEISEGLVAIMGPSGSGKSTLLNSLLSRLTVGLSVTSGEVSINGTPVTSEMLKRCIGYVMQDDIASPLLTVKETLELVTALRFRHVEDLQKRNSRVSDVIEMMSLSHCANNVIGEGLSGGEKKRLSIAVELVAFPRILVLDEPTSALDSLDALLLVQSLRKLVEHHGITVICTIHQPQYKVFSTFSRLILLSQGYIIYDGPIGGVSSYCARKGQPVPAGVNPADKVMDVATDMQVDVDRFSRMPQLDFEQYKSRGPFAAREIAPRSSQFLVLFNRGLIQAKRRRNEFIIATIQTIINAVLIGTVFLNVSNQASKSQTRLAALFYCCTNQGTFGGISSLSVFSSERVLSIRDRHAGFYYAFPYYSAKMLCEILLRLPFPILFSSIVYWLLGLEYEAGHFFFFMFVMWLDNLAACSLAMAVSVWTRLPEISSLVLPLALEVARLFGAFFLAPIDAPDGVHWIMRVSYLSYAYGAIVHNDMEDRNFDCVAPCKYPSTGKAKMESLGLQELSKGEYIGGLIAFIVVCQILTYLGVRIVTW